MMIPPVFTDAYLQFRKFATIHRHSYCTSYIMFSGFLPVSTPKCHFSVTSAALVKMAENIYPGLPELL